MESSLDYIASGCFGVGILAWLHYIYHYVQAMMAFEDWTGLLMLGASLSQSNRVYRIAALCGMLYIFQDLVRNSRETARQILNATAARVLEVDAGEQ